MHAYQVDRSPDDGSILSQLIPCMDALFATLVLIPRTKRVGAALTTSAMALGMIARRLEGKDVVVDALITLGAFVVWMVIERA